MTEATWDSVFMEMARAISQKSKDPSTQVGAVITDPSNRVVSVGFNGFPAGCDDFPWTRPEKYDYVIHAEENALLFANPVMDKHTLYTYPIAPCYRCARLIAQSGIKRVVYWGGSALPVHKTEISERIFKAKGIIIESL